MHAESSKIALNAFSNTEAVYVLGIEKIRN